MVAYSPMEYSEICAQKGAIRKAAGHQNRLQGRPCDHKDKVGGGQTTNTTRANKPQTQISLVTPGPHSCRRASGRKRLQNKSHRRRRGNKGSVERMQKPWAGGSQEGCSPASCDGCRALRKRSARQHTLRLTQRSPHVTRPGSWSATRPALLSSRRILHQWCYSAAFKPAETLVQSRACEKGDGRHADSRIDIFEVFNPAIGGPKPACEKGMGGC